MRRLAERAVGRVAYRTGSFGTPGRFFRYRYKPHPTTVGVVYTQGHLPIRCQVGRCFKRRKRQFAELFEGTDHLLLGEEHLPEEPTHIFIMNHPGVKRGNRDQSREISLADWGR